LRIAVKALIRLNLRLSVTEAEVGSDWRKTRDWAPRSQHHVTWRTARQKFGIDSGGRRPPPQHLLRSQLQFILLIAWRPQNDEQTRRQHHWAERQGQRQDPPASKCLPVANSPRHRPVRHLSDGAVFCLRLTTRRIVHTGIAKNRRQPYAVSEKAGHQTSAESWGTGSCHSWP
jgi:hypothetical protein